MHGALGWMKGRSVWEVSVWAGACLGGGPRLEKSMCLHWVVGNKESVSAGLRPGGRLHPGAKVEKNCSPKPWVTKDNTVRQFHSAVEKLLLELGISSSHRIWIPRNGVSSRNENNRSGLWSLFPLLPSYVKLPPSPSPGEGSSKRPNVACWPQVLPGIWLLFVFNYSIHLTFSHQCHKKLFQRQKDLFSFAPLTNSEN